MGVPSFYRWLLEKYPRCVEYCKEETVVAGADGQPMPIDSTGPNPNGREFDNLYLDMNGIIHPCAHPENGPQPETEEDMMILVFEYIDRIFNLVRPRKVLFMAIDGVAPRAKMNQQRSRRFRAAQERQEHHEAEQMLRAMWTARGKNPPPSKGEPWDSNVITPGTPFMDTLSKALRFWVATKISQDPGWKNIKVVFSDANVPGEGEHKIVQYIRLWRTSAAWDPNTKHCLYGLDADLFMLGFATHECHFTILREEVLFGKERKCQICGQAGHMEFECRGNPDQADYSDKAKPRFQQQAMAHKHCLGEKPANVAFGKKQRPYLFANLTTLREYFSREFAISNLPFPWDLENIIDDFIFLCFLVGNDFLPHLPSLEIREGGIDSLIDIYKAALPNLGGYLSTGPGKLDWKRVRHLLVELGRVEDRVFRQRKEREEAMAKRRKRDDDRTKQRQNSNQKNQNQNQNQLNAPPIKRQQSTDTLLAEASQRVTICEDNKSAAQKLKDMLKGKKNAPQPPAGPKPKLMESKPDAQIESMKSAVSGDPKFEQIFQEVSKRMGDQDENFWYILKGIHKKRDDLSQAPEHQNDDWAAGTNGWKQRYYLKKLRAKHCAENDSDPILQTMWHEYVKGLNWVFRYYYEGCPSWGWYFPFHYSPFASDITDCHRYDLEIEPGQPFRPFDQLMGVLPEASSHALPKDYAALMSGDSIIADFYPNEFRLDLNGKRFAWQAVALLPFIDEERLLEAVAEVDNTLTGPERTRNSLGDVQIYVHQDYPLARQMAQLYVNADLDNGVVPEDELAIDPSLSDGIAGTLKAQADAFLPGRTLESPLPRIDHYKDSKVISCVYCVPPRETPHVTKILPGAIPPRPILTEIDINHMLNGKRFGKPHQRNNNRNRNQGRRQNIMDPSTAGRSMGIEGRRDGWKQSEAGFHGVARGLQQKAFQPAHQPMYHGHNQGQGQSKSHHQGQQQQGQYQQQPPAQYQPHPSQRQVAYQQADAKHQRNQAYQPQARGYGPVQGHHQQGRHDPYARQQQQQQQSYHQHPQRQHGGQQQPGQQVPHDYQSQQRQGHSQSSSSSSSSNRSHPNQHHRY